MKEKKDTKEKKEDKYKAQEESFSNAFRKAILRMQEDVDVSCLELEKLNKLPKITLQQVKDEKFCGEGSKYSESGIIFVYNKEDEIIAIFPMFGQHNSKESLYDTVKNYKEIKYYLDGWYQEMYYVKFLDEPHADPLDLCYMVPEYDKYFKPKYEKQTVFTIDDEEYTL